MIKENLIFQAYEIHDKKRKNNGPLWENTPYEKYEKAAAKTKGCYGELIVSNFISFIYNLKQKQLLMIGYSCFYHI